MSENSQLNLGTERRDSPKIKKKRPIEKHRGSTERANATAIFVTGRVEFFVSKSYDVETFTWFTHEYHVCLIFVKFKEIKQV